MTGTKDLPVFNNVCIQIFYIDFKWSTVMGCLVRGSQFHHFAVCVLGDFFLTRETRIDKRISLLARHSFPLALLNHPPRSPFLYTVNSLPGNFPG